MGNLCSVINYPSGKTYDLDYDLLDRLMRVRDHEGNCYEYTYDANNNMTRMYHASGTGGIAASYTYDKDNREVTAKATGSYHRTTSYDSLGRVSSQKWSTQTPYSITYGYAQPDAKRRSVLPSTMGIGGRILKYTYDRNGNITKITDTAPGGETKTVTYQYDELNQLTRENNGIQGKTTVYSYDTGGNLTSVKNYPYTEASTLTAPWKQRRDPMTKPGRTSSRHGKRQITTGKRHPSG